MEETEKRKYNILRIAGFLSFEAMALSEEPINTLYMQGLIKERYEIFTKARKEGLSWPDYTKMIEELYSKSGWFVGLSDGGKVKHDPMLMLADAKQRYSKGGVN